MLHEYFQRGDGEEMPVHLHAAGSLDAFWALFDEWCDHMRARDMTAETIEQREAYLLRFFRRTRTSPESVTEGVCEGFLATVTPRSSKREAYVAALRSFYRFAAARGYVDQNPAADLHARQPKYPPPDFFSASEVTAILDAALSRPPAMRRPAIVLLFETGARIGSLAAVRPRDCSAERIHFATAKNDRAYDVVLTPAAVRAVEELRICYGGGPTLIGRTATTIGEWFREAARDAGLPEGRVNAHLARHTAATTLYERTRDPLLVKDFLNHSDLSQIARYARVKDETMREALSRSLTG
jgi:integrase